jgi:hypothetical protein
LINNVTLKLYEKYPIWNNIAYLRNVSVDKIFEYFDKFNLISIYNILKFRQLITYQLEMIINKFHVDDQIWVFISEHQTIEKDILEKYQDNLNWEYISENYDFSEEEIIKYDNKIDYIKLSYNDNLTEYWMNSIKLNKKINKLDKDFLIKNEIIKHENFTEK